MDQGWTFCKGKRLPRTPNTQGTRAGRLIKMTKITVMRNQITETA